MHFDPNGSFGLARAKVRLSTFFSWPVNPAMELPPHSSKPCYDSSLWKALSGKNGEEKKLAWQRLSIQSLIRVIATQALKTRQHNISPIIAPRYADASAAIARATPHSDPAHSRSHVDTNCSGGGRTLVYTLDMHIML